MMKRRKKMHFLPIKVAHIFITIICTFIADTQYKLRDVLHNEIMVSSICACIIQHNPDKSYVIRH